MIHKFRVFKDSQILRILCKETVFQISKNQVNSFSRAESGLNLRNSDLELYSVYLFKVKDTFTLVYLIQEDKALPFIYILFKSLRSE